MNKNKNRFFIAIIAGIIVFALGTGMMIYGTWIRPKALATAAKAEQLLAEQTALLNRLIQQYDYDKGLELLAQMKQKEEEKQAKEQQILELKNSLVEYVGEVPHIFTHSLIVYPELAFDGDYKEEGYDLWMTTVREFKLILEQLYQKGYVLYDIRNLIEKDEQGNVAKRPIYLPPGKTPLILSVDDVCYYDYMKGDGFAEKLVLDQNGEVATLVPNPQGERQITRDGDIFPIVDDFVKAHPDFSYQGAKGILAVTGYEGVLGYRITDFTGAELQQLVDEVTPVVTRLKETGWIFASHSYTHNDYFKTGSITMEQMAYDAGRWDRDIKPVVGETNVYISPFGVKYDQADSRYRYLMETYGFEIYCNVGGTVPAKYYPDNMVMGRYAVDGLSMRQSKKILNKFFDCDLVIDPARPK